MDVQWVRVNGEQYPLPASEGRRLIDWLREDLHLTGAKDGCSTGDCGGCSVLLNGRIVPGCCLLVASIAGQEITTIEGIAAKTPEDPLLEAFMTRGAFQCGYCTPGMIVAARSFLDLTATCSPDTPISCADVREAISGNICRCTGYIQIIDAILTAAAQQGLSCESLGQYIYVNEK